MTWRLLLFAATVALVVGAAIGAAVYLVLVEGWDTGGDE